MLVVFGRVGLGLAPSMPEPPAPGTGEREALERAVLLAPAGEAPGAGVLGAAGELVAAPAAVAESLPHQC